MQIIGTKVFGGSTFICDLDISLAVQYLLVAGGGGGAQGDNGVPGGGGGAGGAGGFLSGSINFTPGETYIQLLLAPAVQQMSMVLIPV